MLVEASVESNVAWLLWNSDCATFTTSLAVVQASRRARTVDGQEHSLREQQLVRERVMFKWPAVLVEFNSQTNHRLSHKLTGYSNAEV